MYPYLPWNLLAFARGRAPRRGGKLESGRRRRGPMQGHPKPSLSAARTGTDWRCGFAVEGPPFSGLVGRTRAFRIASFDCEDGNFLLLECCECGRRGGDDVAGCVSAPARPRRRARKTLQWRTSDRTSGNRGSRGLAGKPGARDQPQKTKDVAVCPRLPLQRVGVSEGGREGTGWTTGEVGGVEGYLVVRLSSTASRSIPH
jgi:hypothetical protein